mgnify:FL=1
MLKTRLIPCIITRGEMVVQSYNFSRYLPIGNIKTAIEFFVNWDVDEIVVIDITASKEDRSPNLDLIDWASSECFVPLTVGGGIRDTQDIKGLINSGADKVCINSIVRKNPDIINESSEIFGSQCITVSLDVIFYDNKHYIYDYQNRNTIDTNLEEFILDIQDRGCGEIFLNSVDRDGSRKGYDIEVINTINNIAKIPVIACGGVGRSYHFSEAVIKTNCSGVSAANIFQHTEHSTIAAKAMMIKEGLNVRLNGEVNYKEFEFDDTGRPY